MGCSQWILSCPARGKREVEAEGAEEQEEQEEEEEEEQEEEEWTCERDCGFKGDFATVITHEATCTATATTSSDTRTEVSAEHVWDMTVRLRTWFERADRTAIWWPIKGIRLAAKKWPDLAAFLSNEERAAWLRGVEMVEVERTVVEHGEGSKHHLRLLELGFGGPLC